MWKVVRTATTLALAVALLATPGALSQSLQKDNGHCATTSGATVFACWNFQAGAAIPESLSDYPEFLPFLKGWDFRINLPHIRLQRASAGAGGPATLAGVVEDATPVTDAGGTLFRYGHKNNAIWMFRVLEADKHLYAKALPSRRAPTGSTAENVVSLTSGWSPVGAGGPTLLREKAAVAVLGEGIGSTTVYAVARDERASPRLLFAKLPVGSTNPSWSSVGWSPVGGSSTTAASLVPAFGSRLALAWRDPEERIRVRLYNPAANAWAPAVVLPEPAAAAAPQLVWDGSALNVFFVSKATGHLVHAFATAASPLAFRDLVQVSSVPVRGSFFHALAHNGRLHVAITITTLFGSPVRYTVDDGSRSKWFTPADVGFNSAGAPQLVALSDNLMVTAVGPDHRVHYSRRDPNRRGPESTGVNSSGLWLTPGAQLDGIAGFSGGVDTLAFNRDVYLTASNESGASVVNMSRAVLKSLITSRWGIKLRWGSLGGSGITDAAGAPLVFTKGEEIPRIGDVDGDGEDDLLRFTQKAQSGVGPAPVFVARGGEWQSRLWHAFFSLKGEIPDVGDFNGDDKDDIVTFVQKEQKNANGTSIGPAPVWVSLSTGARFQTSSVWHTFFSLKGEIPLVGDFNGDDKDDIVTFVQKEQKNANGTSIGPAPVWVSLSNGSKFQTSRIWHTFFSLKGEVPMVGDFNGDGKDDIITFVQKLQKNADGSVLGQAPVWVALSNGSKFEQSRVWHTFFSLKGEVPQVGDFDLDGRDDIVTFIHDHVTGDSARNVYVALSDGSRFARSSTWASDFASKDQIPMVANFGGRLGQITGRPQDADKKTADLVAFDQVSGRVGLLTSMSGDPYPAGAPWERYKWFTDKGLGVTEFPEWIFQRPNHCIGTPHRLVLLGAAGSGGPDVTNLSVRLGSRAGHVIEELGHSTFANCFRKASDPLNAGIYTDDGVNAGNLWGGGPQSSVDCAGGVAAETISIPPPVSSGSPFGFYDCRNDIAEHYFLALLIHYRLDGDEFRGLIKRTTNVARKLRLTTQYNWIKNNWFNGAEFKRGPAVNGGLTADGLLCLPGECRFG